MTETNPKEQSSGTNIGELTKQEIIHHYKMSLVRECQIFGKSLKETQVYFKSKGFTLSKSSWMNYKKELKSAKTAKDWFSKEALYVIEEDHMVSVERTRGFEDNLVKQMNKLVADDDFDTEVSYETKEDKTVKLRVKNYNLELYSRLLGDFRALQETKTKMFSATPMVQEMMEVHRMHEEEANRPKPTAKTEKPVKPQ